jgi:hypothetical protein
MYHQGRCYVDWKRPEICRCHLQPWRTINNNNSNNDNIEIIIIINIQFLCIHSVWMWAVLSHSPSTECLHPRAKLLSTINYFLIWERERLSFMRQPVDLSSKYTTFFFFTVNKQYELYIITYVSMFKLKVFFFQEPIYQNKHFRSYSCFSPIFWCLDRPTWSGVSV